MLSFSYFSLKTYAKVLIRSASLRHFYSVHTTYFCRNKKSMNDFWLNQSTDRPGGSIVSECRLEHGPERGQDSFNP